VSHLTGDQYNPGARASFDRLGDPISATFSIFRDPPPYNLFNLQLKLFDNSLRQFATRTTNYDDGPASDQLFGKDFDRAFTVRRLLHRREGRW
jgi:hypothetical protein